MDRRSFLGLMVKVAGTAVVLPLIKLPTLVTPDSRELKADMMRGTFSVTHIRALLRTTDGDFAGDTLKHTKIDVQRNKAIISFEEFVALHHMSIKSALFYYKGKPSLETKFGQGHSIPLFPHDSFRLYYTLELS